MRFLKLSVLVGAVAGLAYAMNQAKRPKSQGQGSQTNASEAMDDIELSADPHPEEVLDAGVKGTFPASDPVSVDSTSETAYEKEQRRQRSG
jgi:hypothetical protein